MSQRGLASCLHQWKHDIYILVCTHHSSFRMGYAHPPLVQQGNAPLHAEPVNTCNGEWRIRQAKRTAHLPCIPYHAGLKSLFKALCFIPCDLVATMSPKVQHTAVWRSSRSRSPPHRADMQIFVRMLPKKTITCDVNASDKIYNVKAKIQEQEGIPQDQQRLFFALEPMEDFHVLSHFNIHQYSAIYLVLSPQGECHPWCHQCKAKAGYVEYVFEDDDL